MGFINRALTFAGLQKPSPPLLPAQFVEVEVAVTHGRQSYTAYEVWQDRVLVAESTERVFRALIRPGLPFGVTGRNGSGAMLVSAQCTVMSNPLIAPDQRWIRYPQLPPGQKPPATSANLQMPQIEQIVGFKLRYGPRGEAILVPLDTGSDSPDNGIARSESVEIRDGMVCGVHDFPPDLVRNLASAVGANPAEFMLESQVVPLDDAALQASIARARLLNTSPAYQAFLNTYQVAYSTKGQWMRRLIVTAPARKVLTRATGATTGLAEADALSPYEWSQMAYECQTGRYHRDDGVDAVEQHPFQEAFCQPRFRDQFYEVGTQTAAYVALRLTTTELETAMQQPVDIIYRFQNKAGDRLFVQGVARLHGTPPHMASLEASIPGHARRVYGVMGDDRRAMERVHYAFLPGSPSQPPFRAHGIFHWGKFLDTFARATDALGVACGDLVIGHTWGERERLITYNSASTNSIIFLGPTGSGKTVKAMEMALGRTPLVIMLHVSRPKESWTGQCAKSLGGQFLTWEGVEATDAEAFRSASVALEEEVITWIGELSQRWDEGDFSSLPLVIQRESGNQFLYFRYLQLIIEQFLGALGDAAQKHGVPVVVIIDDIISAAKNASDPRIGQEAPNAATGLREAIHDAVNVLRTANTAVYVTGHGFQSVTGTYGTGFLQDFPLAVVFSSEPNFQYKRAELFYAPRVIASSVSDVQDEADKPTLKPSGWRGYIQCTIGREILAAMGVPPYNQKTE